MLYYVILLNQVWLSLIYNQCLTGRYSRFTKRSYLVGRIRLSEPPQNKNRDYSSSIKARFVTLGIVHTCVYIKPVDNILRLIVFVVCQFEILIMQLLKIVDAIFFKIFSMRNSNMNIYSKKMPIVRVFVCLSRPLIRTMPVTRKVNKLTFINFIR